ncbi:polysaccharide deacetylase family protein [Sneathiella sp.]|jgi:hypothetical protein|uniref:polysaccharide deacetylase family protein n=1 Tax=Sneathiella sp. TaxID=1964365 RepID=UPI0039E56680
MADWDLLQAELDEWLDAGKRATFWWRDDDLNEPTDAFMRLLQLRAALDIPLGLAVIPDRVDPHIADEADGCLFLQHGVLHQNFADTGQKKCEFPDTRPVDESLSDILSGKSRMEELFGDQFLPVFVPPWNRITSRLLGPLAEAGFVGLSRYKARENAVHSGGLVEINTHVDPIFWRGNRSALDEKEVLALVIRHLQARRSGGVDALEPTGLLTHHLVHDEAIWEITFKLLSFLNSHKAVRWMTFPGAMALVE